MTEKSVARVPTTHGSRYLQQLCKHWSHNLAVEFTPQAGTVTFPREMRGNVFPTEGVARMSATPDTLEVTIEGGDAAHVAQLRKVVADHLDRFAFREAPLPFDWAAG